MIKNKNLKEFLLYLVVGGVATVTEWLMFFVLEKTALHYMLATVIAYVIATFVNWLAGRVLVFKESKKAVIKEILEIYLASIVGLLLNLGLMWLMVDAFDFNEMLSKIIATGLVFLYNFLIRKLVIYKKK
ncbi:MAG: GtrA family protein [Clostridia bacterium]|nr:GtrA family protein [Clostridia bacterium]